MSAVGADAISRLTAHAGDIPGFVCLADLQRMDEMRQYSCLESVIAAEVTWGLNNGDATAACTTLADAFRNGGSIWLMLMYSALGGQISVSDQTFRTISGMAVRNLLTSEWASQQAANGQTTCSNVLTDQTAYWDSLTAPERDSWREDVLGRWSQIIWGDLMAATTTALRGG